jgi:hypothetical protein
MSTTGGSFSASLTRFSWALKKDLIRSSLSFRATPSAAAHLEAGLECALIGMSALLQQRVLLNPP